MKASSSKLRYADNNNDVIDDHTKVEKTVDDHDVVDVDGENANGVGDEKTFDNEKKGGRRSFVWDHFTFVKGVTKAPCRYYKMVIACAGKKNGTSTLSNHLTNVCRTSPVYKKNIDLNKQATLSFKPISEGDIASGSLATHSCCQERCRKALARLCKKDNQPFSIVDNEGFQDYSWEMNPLFKMPSSWTVAKDCLKMYKEEEKKLKGLLKDQTILLYGDDKDDFADNTWKRKRKEKVVGAPEEDDWENAMQFIEYLMVFYNVTNLISGSKYVTSNLFFGELVTMHASISRMCVDEDEQKRALAALVKDKYDKYWDNIDNINFLLYVVVFLDPRNKLFYLDYCLGQIYGMNSDKTKVMSKKVVKTLNESIQHYRMKEDRVNAQNKKNSAYSTSDSNGRSTLGPANVLVFGWVGGKHACVDLTGVSPPVGLSSRGFIAGQAALKAASGKVTKHEKACIENQHVFILFAFDTFGFLAPEAVELLSRVQRVMHSNVMIPRSTDVIFKPIGFAIQKGLAAQLVARLPYTTM
nr:zinc finger, BED-type [Tanacetum cinerariifolium]